MIGLSLVTTSFAVSAEPAADLMDVSYVFEHELVDVESRAEFFVRYRREVIGRLSTPTPGASMEHLVEADRAGLALLVTRSRECYEGILEDHELFGQDRQNVLREVREAGVLLAILADAWGAAEDAQDPLQAQRFLANSMLLLPSPITDPAEIDVIRAFVQQQAATLEAQGLSPAIEIDQRIIAAVTPAQMAALLREASSAEAGAWGRVESDLVYVAPDLAGRGRVVVRCRPSDEVGTETARMIIHPVVILLVPKGP